MEELSHTERSDALVDPALTGDDVQLLWSLGIPVYQDGRVEAERVAKVYREVLYPAINRVKEDNHRLKESAEFEADLMQKLADLMSHIHEMGEQLDQRDREQLNRAEALIAAERSLMERIGQLRADLDRSETMLAEAHAQLERVQQLSGSEHRLEALVSRGSKLLEQLASVSQDAERNAALCAKARRVLNLAVETEEETRRMAEEAARRLRAALELAMEEMPPIRVEPQPIEMASDLPSVELDQPATDFVIGEQQKVEHTPREIIKEVRFASESLLPASRFQLKRRLVDLLGEERVFDAPDGPGLLLTCKLDETDYVTAATLETAVELGLEAEVIDASDELVLATALNMDDGEADDILGVGDA